MNPENSRITREREAQRPSTPHGNGELSSASDLTLLPLKQDAPTPMQRVSNPLLWLQSRLDPAVSGVLSRLVSELESTPKEQHPTLLNRVVTNDGQTLIHLATGPDRWKHFPEIFSSEERNSSGLAGDSRRQIDTLNRLPSLLIALGADPFARDHIGRIPILSDSVIYTERTLSTALERNPTEFASRLSHHEKLYLYVNYALAFYNRGPLTDKLFEALFKSDGDLPPTSDSHRESSRSLDPSERYSTARLLSERYLTNNTSPIEALLQAAKQLTDKGVCPLEVVTTLINQIPDETGYTLSHRIVSVGDFRFTEIASLFVGLGGQFTIPIKSGPETGRTAYHIAADNSMLSGLCKHTPIQAIDAQTQDCNGNTPLLLYLNRNAHSSDYIPPNCADAVSAVTPNNGGDLPLKIALKFCKLEVAHALIALGATLPEDAPFYQRLLLVTDEGAKLRSLWRDVREMLLTVADEFGSQYAQKLLPSFINNCAHNISPLRSARTEGKSALSPESPWTSLTREAPGLFHSSKSWIISTVAASIEKQFDFHRELSGFHPNEAELLLFAGLRVKEEYSAVYDQQLVYAITSTRRFIDHDIHSLPTTAVALWGDIGRIGFEFLNLKHDTRRFINRDGVETTLLEEYGCKRQPATYERVPWYRKVGVWLGILPPPAQKSPPSFVLSVDEHHEIGATRRILKNDGVALSYLQAEPNTVVRWSKEFVTIESPEHGVVAIRNSSPEGGRATLLHPAYVLSPEAREQLLSQNIGGDGWSAKVIESEFTEILDRSLYPSSELGPELLHAASLLSHYRTILRDYRSWLCNMTAESAYLDDPDHGQGYLVGAYKSDGFGTMLDALQYWLERGDELQLEFHPEKIPAWHPFATLPINTETLENLRRLTREDFTSPTLHSSGVFDFIQRGLNSFGDLVIKNS